MPPHRPPTSSYRWVCLGVLFLSAFLAFLTRLAPAVALPNLQLTFGLTAAELSLLTALYLWPFALMQPVAGLLTDRLGPRRSVTIFLVIAGLGQLLFALAPSFASALLGRAATGIGGSILYVAAAKIMAQWFRRREFGTLTGAWTSVANLGGIVAAAPLAALLYAFLLFGTMTMMQGLWAVPYLIDIYGYTQQEAANRLTLWAVGLIVGCTLWGYVADRVVKTRRGVICTGAVVFAFLWLLLAVKPVGLPAGVLQVAMFWGGFFASTWIPAYAQLKEAVPPQVVATSNSVNSF